MSDPKKIIILGGGMASLTAAFYLTDSSGWQQDYDITVFQRGWRLGGKAASGRDAKNGQRVQDAGEVHVWGGSYENAFRMMRACYDELGRPAGAPLRHVDDAFSEQPLLFMKEELPNGSWSTWPLAFPITSDSPGEGSEYPGVWSFIERLTGWLVEAMRDFPLTTVRDQSREALEGDSNRLLPAWLRELSRDAARVIGRIFDGSPFWLLREAWGLSSRLLTNDESFASDMVMVVDYLAQFMDWIEEEVYEQIEQDTSARRIYTLMAIGITVVRGLITDNILSDNYYAIDDFDLREWLLRHGAHHRIAHSAPIKACYDYFFAYRHGDPDAPRLSAGIALNHMIKLVGAYKGSIFWKMNAGVGDVVFGPLYEVLKARGVKFEFFQQVDAIELTSDYERIGRVVLSSQAQVSSGDYEPLIDVRGLPCWPGEPLWDQLDDGATLAGQGHNFERRDGWTPTSTRTLEVDQDFDIVLSGISVGELPIIASSLIDNKRGWDSMVDQLETIPTVSVRLDFNEDRVALGWRQPNALLSAYAAPLGSWEDRTAMLLREQWLDGEAPKNIATYCGAYPTAQPESSVSHVVRVWLDAHLGGLFPNAMSPAGSTQFDYSKLVDLEGGVGAARFDSQYVHLSPSPSDHYVLSLPKTSRFCLGADTSGYDNLVLAGDWLYTGMGGTMEAATMTGMMAARALCGSPGKIAWEIQVYPWQREVCITSLRQNPLAPT